MSEPVVPVDAPRFRLVEQFTGELAVVCGENCDCGEES